MKKQLIIGVLACLSVACGDDSDKSDNTTLPDGTTITDKAGPASLSGVRWSSETVNVNGLDLKLGFEFKDNEVVAYSTCNGTTTVSTSSPASYTYTAQITQGARDEAVDGDDGCFVEVPVGTFDFEQIGNDLQVTAVGETLLFEGSGENQGLYGRWTYETELYGLTWWMGNGSLTARSECHETNLSAEVTVPATYRNFVVIEQDASGGDDVCNVGIQAGKIEYRMSGDTLTFIIDGQELTLKR